MRRMGLGLLAFAALWLPGSLARAQVATAGTASGFSDPFYLYYSWFLPRQQYLANTPGPEMAISNRAGARADAAIVDRSALFEPMPGLGEDMSLDPLRPFGPQHGRSPLVRTTPTGIVSQNLRGTGPPAYFNRVGNYHPTLRTGRNTRNNSLPTLRGGRFNMGAYSAMSSGQPSIPSR